MEQLMCIALAIISPSDFALPAAVAWIEATLLGSVATGVAVLALAFLGFGMLSGRLDWQTGLRVVLGVFILFGAPSIARELASLGRGAEVPALASSNSQLPPFEPVRGAPDPDPYAGAAMTR
jgi:type IV secretion system protein VirB2